MKIKICADSTCDLSKELIERYNVGVMPLHVALGDDDRLDGVTIVPDDIYAYYASAKNFLVRAQGVRRNIKSFLKNF